MIRGRMVWPSGPFLETFRRGAIQRAEGAALYATDKAIRLSQRNLQAGFHEVGLGRAARVIGVTSDLRKGRVHRFGAEGFSASGVQFQKVRGERLDGLIESYGKGATITPKQSRWLWIATDEIPSRAGKRRMTPARYVAAGFERKIGPLVMIRSINGNPLLVVRGASVSATGKRRSAKALTRTGKPRKGQRPKDFIVAFVGIPRTQRFQRFDAQALLREAAAKVPNHVDEYLRRNR